MTELIDTHAHLYDQDFEIDITDVVADAKNIGVSKIVLPAVDSSSYNKMTELSLSLQGFAYPSLGLHPTSVKENWREELEFVLEKIDQHNFIAIGEIGLDGYWSKDHFSEQITVFEEQLKLAAKKELPVIIHSRDATEEIFKVLERNSSLSLRGVFHAFSGSYQTYERILRIGNFKIGVGGVVTYKNSNLPAVLEKVSLESILLETDAPWLTPAPFRGKRNQPAYVKIIAQKLAEIKGCSYDEICSVTSSNAYNIFNFR
ncbi:MAG: hydrolase TatD [Bacteroidetes bacterium HGW-Bacteroidetes-5]|jgi:TatD DNase family protein|nr:MAG: hydrolase TatD [Bacteroidetes bacterium HGW-Bacteroidetes-5]